MRAIVIRLCQWTLRKLNCWYPISFEIEGVTELMLEDVPTVYCPLPVGPGHCVDLGYDFDGRLVAIKIWADVTTREKLQQIRLKE